MSSWSRVGRVAATSVLASVCTSLAAGVALGQTPPDFLFDQPRYTIGLRFGYAVPRASSDVFDFTREQLTIEKRDFEATALGVEFAVRAHDRIDVAAVLQFSESEKRSEFREFVGTDELPIEQTIRMSRAPLTASLKAYIVDRGRSIGRFVWIPSTFAPYMGAGGGAVWYAFEQDGEFVDFETLDIFQDSFRSESVTATWHVLGGFEVAVGPRFVALAEGRYSWASASLGSDFVGFDEIDLAGFQATVGVAVRF